MLLPEYFSFVTGGEKVLQNVHISVRQPAVGPLYRTVVTGM
jgi:hypothetical protein